jgi:2-deoxy-D-gluconate 3-dehydrogenase
MNLELDGHVAVVTGASRGIGRAVATALAAEGVRVIAAARTLDDLKSLEADWPANIRSQFCDVRNHDAIRGLVDRAINEFGRLDIVVNDAAYREAPYSQLLDQEFGSWDEILSINVTAPAVLAQAAGRHFVGQRSGKVINIASTCSIRGVAGLVAYCTSKGALLQFTRALAIEWAPFGIQVNAVGPGGTATPAYKDLLEGPRERLDERLARIPDGQLGEPREVASVVCYLASPISNHINGTLVMVDGGETVKLF